MTSPNKYHPPKGTSADGPYEVFVTPESAGWGHSGRRVLTLKPGASHALSTGDSEFLVLALTGGCTVTVGSRPLPPQRHGRSRTGPCLADLRRARARMGGGTWDARDTDDRLPFGAEENE